MYRLLSGFVIGGLFLIVGCGERVRFKMCRAVALESKRLVWVASFKSLFLCLAIVTLLHLPEHSHE